MNMTERRHVFRPLSGKYESSLNFALHADGRLAWLKSAKLRAFESSTN
jgi:hypothetical protein